MVKNVYYIDCERKKRNTAGAKAPGDIAHICNELGFSRFVVPSLIESKSKLIKKIWVYVVCTKWWNKLNQIIKADDVIIFQHPMYGKRVALKKIRKIKKKKKCQFISIVHDLESLRGGIEGVIASNEKTNKIGDNVLLKEFDIVICHNKKMKQYMIEKGFDKDKLICLEIFDYLSNVKRVQPPKENIPSIAIAGNLAIGKCSYIYKLFENGNNSNLKVNLYGINFQKEKSNKNMIYHGSFKPEELVGELEGDFGLVWDGRSEITCEGNTGEYLKYNNPHKTSLYLSAGMPIIVWEKAAIADFVKDNDVGIIVSDLCNLDKIISGISENRYEKMKNNAKQLSEKLSNGYYTKKALEKSLNCL